MKRGWMASVVVAMSLSIAASPAEASLTGGLSKIFGAAFQLPMGILAGTLAGPPVVGTAFGALRGAFSTAGLLAGGTVEVAAASFSVAKAAAPLVLPFLF